MDTRYYEEYSHSCPQQSFGCSLVYDNQIEFKHWARRHGLSKKNGADYYFDCITQVDARDPMKQNDIPGFLADGKITWGEALKILKKYFKIAA